MPAKTIQATSAICAHISEYENLAFSFETSQLKMSLVGFMPTRCNTSVNTNDDGTRSEWLQILSTFAKEYSRTDTDGVQHDDNASLNTLKVKVKEQHLIDNGITGAEFKEFMESFYVGKRFLFLPTTGESPVFQTVFINGQRKRELVPNAYETVIHPSFSIREFMELTKKQFESEEKRKHGNTPPLPEPDKSK